MDPKQNGAAASGAVGVVTDLYEETLHTDRRTGRTMRVGDPVLLDRTGCVVMFSAPTGRSIGETVAAAARAGEEQNMQTLLANQLASQVALDADPFGDDEDEDAGPELADLTFSQLSSCVDELRSDLRAEAAAADVYQKRAEEAAAENDKLRKELDQARQGRNELDQLRTAAGAAKAESDRLERDNKNLRIAIEEMSHTERALRKELYENRSNSGVRVALDAKQAELDNVRKLLYEAQNQALLLRGRCEHLEAKAQKSEDETNRLRAANMELAGKCDRRAKELHAMRAAHRRTIDLVRNGREVVAALQRLIDARFPNPVNAEHERPRTLAKAVTDWRDAVLVEAEKSLSEAYPNDLGYLDRTHNDWTTGFMRPSSFYGIASKGCW